MTPPLTLIHPLSMADYLGIRLGIRPLVLYLPERMRIQPSLTQTYFIADTSCSVVKIGKSNNPQKRLQYLQIAHHTHLSLLITIDGDYEEKYHKVFAAFRVRGEWFTWDDSKTELVFYIATGHVRRPDESLYDLEHDFEED